MNILMNVMKKPIIIGLVAILLLGVAVYVYRNSSGKNVYEQIAVKRGEVTQKVNVTGQVKPIQSVDLAFEKGGKVAFVYADVGAQVAQNQELVSLVNTDLAAQLAQAQASVESARASLEQYKAALVVQQAKLDELRQGTRPEELASAQITLQNAQTNLQNIKNKADLDIANLYGQVKNVLNDAYAKADDAISKQIDDMFSDDASANPHLTFSVANSQAQVDAEWGRFLAGQNLNALRLTISTLGSDQVSLDKALVSVQSTVSSLLDFLNRLSDALNAQVSLSASTVSTYRGYINTARTNINTALSNINSQQQDIASQKIANQNAIATAQSTLNDAQSQLALKQAGSTPQAISAQIGAVAQAQANIASQQAQIRQAIANAQNIEAQISKTVIRSPLAGVVTKQDAKVGEIVPPNTPVVSVIAQSSLEIEANIPEVDIGKVALGNPVNITVDALPGETFQGKVIHIDPAQTIIDGVNNFKVRVAFDKEDTRFKSGLTANLSVEVLKKEGVLVLPQIAILENDQGTFVQTLKGNAIIQIPVQVGIRGEDGSAEIISGVSEGQQVLNVGKKTN